MVLLSITPVVVQAIQIGDSQCLGLAVAEGREEDN